MLLEELDKTYPPSISFHLRELYLNFNLIQVAPHNKENQVMFNHLNDPFLHQYFLYLFSASIAPEAILPYIKSLEFNHQKNALKSVVEYANLRNISGVYQLVG